MQGVCIWSMKLQNAVLVLICWAEACLPCHAKIGRTDLCCSACRAQHGGEEHGDEGNNVGGAVGCMRTVRAL